MAILQTIQLEKRFGGILAAQNVNLAIEPGARHALIGPNGAGKTTVINLLTGVLRPTGGRILLEGRDITGLLPHQRVRLGMARTFQINQLFLDLTPLESIGLVISERLGSGADWWRLVGTKPAVTEEIAEVVERFRLRLIVDLKREFESRELGQQLRLRRQSRKKIAIRRERPLHLLRSLRPLAAAEVIHGQRIRHMRLTRGQVRRR